jgi:hypothetical protein
MQFATTILALAFAATTFAAPSALDKRWDPRCLGECKQVTNEIGCISWNMWVEDPQAVQNCVGDNALLCSCTECLSGLDSYVAENGIC